ncbi:MAG: hypothetical protein RL205_701 [Actinomycetota bacterium]|jgi:hypothetical protein
MLPFRSVGVMVLLLAMLAIGAPSAHAENSPWYPSLQAFEHYDSARSHLISEARYFTIVTREGKSRPRGGYWGALGARNSGAYTLPVMEHPS